MNKEKGAEPMTESSGHLGEPQAMAEAIAERLFTNGLGQKAERLVLELGDKRNGGGRCKGAVIDQILNVMREGKP